MWWSWFPAYFPCSGVSLREVMPECSWLGRVGMGRVMIDPNVFSAWVCVYYMGTYVHTFDRSDYKNC